MSNPSDNSAWNTNSQDPYAQPSASDPFAQQSQPSADPFAQPSAPSASDPYGQSQPQQPAADPYGQSQPQQPAGAGFGQPQAYNAPGAAPAAAGASAGQSRMLVGLLGIFFGGYGVHRFMLGYTTIGIIQIVTTFLTCGIGALWGLIEGIMILAKAEPFNHDAQGRPLVD